MKDLKLKDYKYIAPGKETDSLWREVTGPFYACMITFLTLVFIGVVAYFADAIDTIDPLYQMFGCVMICSIVFVICITKTLRK